VNIGLIAALPAEVRCLTHQPIRPNLPLRINNYITVMVCGIGPFAAGKAAEIMLFQKIDGLISWGIAGALTEELHSGDVVLPEYIHTETGDKYKTDTVWHCNLKKKLESTIIALHTGMLAETGSVLETREQKADLHKHTGAIVADMESAAIMRVAHKNNLPFVAVRSVIDEAHDVIPAELTRHIDIFGTLDISGLITEFFYRPRLVIDGYSLFRAMKSARVTLGKIAAEIDESVLPAV
jgi:adenosylhomocysteine nucleosidase